MSKRLNLIIILVVAIVIVVFSLFYHVDNEIHRCFNQKSEVHQEKKAGFADQNVSHESRAQELANGGAATVFARPPQGIDKSIFPVGDLLRIYVYEGLPKEIGKDVEDFLYERYRQLKPIQPNELPWILLFRSYPGRTWNPLDADLFVVPYAHGGHCAYYEGWELRCRHVPLELTTATLFSSLPHFSGNETRHLFLLSNDRYLSHKHLIDKALTLSFGPRTGDPPLPGQMISTIFNDIPQYQPSVLMSKNEDWWTRPRRYSFVCFFGEVNRRVRNTPRRFRRYFHQDMDRETDEKGMLGGLPYHFEPVEGRILVNATKAYDLYSNSVFCPVLCGDAPWQRRFFDVILAGCIPVVLSWKLDDETTTFFVPDAKRSLADTYPFAKGLFGGDETIEIDYESLVVQCAGNRGENESDVSCLRRTMEDMLLRRHDEIRKKQLQLKRYALAFSLGVGEDAHRYEDSFARTIRALKYYYDHHVRL